jgi:tRNA (adenine22-N1)-methyltransferase
MIKLSKRLERIAEQVPKGTRLADIGTDHALLPVFLVQKGIISRAVAGDVNPGPLAAAKQQVEAAGLSDNIDVRLGDGLTVIKQGEVDIVNIAGMGGSLMTDILTAGLDKLEGVNRLILQPNVSGDQVRSWLISRDWHLSAEELIGEDGFFYEILTAERKEEARTLNKRLYAPLQLKCGLIVSAERLLEMGPYLIKQPDENFFAKWEGELQKKRRIAAQMRLSEQSAAQEKLDIWLREIAEIEEVLECLRKDKP